ncbi:MAG: hypothetical protein AABW80_04680 [Nanoarchaeota archaeon]
MNKKIILIFMLLVLVPQTSALLNNTLADFSTKHCALIDYGKIDTSLLKATFSTVEQQSNYNCGIVVDYLPFEDFTNNTFRLELGGLYGLVSPYSVLNSSGDIINYVVILGKNISAVNELVRLTADFSSNPSIFGQSFAVFVSSEDVVQFDSNSKTVSFEVCGEDTVINYSISSSVNGSSSSCINERTLFYPYCSNNTISLDVVNCGSGCSSGACKINASSGNVDNVIVSNPGGSGGGGGGGGGGSRSRSSSGSGSSGSGIVPSSSGSQSFSDDSESPIDDKEEADAESGTEVELESGLIQRFIEWLKNLFG